MHANAIAMTGIKPTGDPHLGNYLGMIEPALRLAREHQSYLFVADYHALTTMRDPADLARRTTDVAAALLALGAAETGAALFRQSDVPEIFELAIVLSGLTAKGLLNRAHAYKAALAANRAAGRSDDDGVSAGLYTYPLLMAADILALDAALVPVGRDQRQHVETARAIATSFNAAYGDVLRVPALRSEAEVATVPGTDGRKMSKSYDNVLALFAPEDELRRRIRRIVTTPRAAHEPADPDTSGLFAIYAAVAPGQAVDELRERYLAGGVAYGEVKDDLAERFLARFATARRRHAELMAEPDAVDRALAAGAAQPRAVARDMLDRVRDAVGVRRLVATGSR